MLITAPTSSSVFMGEVLDVPISVIVYTTQNTPGEGYEVEMSVLYDEGT